MKKTIIALGQWGQKHWLQLIIIGLVVAEEVLTQEMPSEGTTTPTQGNTTTPATDSQPSDGNVPSTSGYK